MSSNDKYHNEEHNNQTWSHGFNEEGCLPRPPNIATESRILGKIVKNEHEVTPNRDFSNPPPNVGQVPQVSASQQPLTLPKVSIQLSADAEEFVPRAQARNPEESHTLSVTAAEFVPRGSEGLYSYSDPYYPNQSFDSYNPDLNTILDDFSTLNLQNSFDPYSFYEVSAENTGDAILDRFNYTLNILNMHPGNMEEYLRPICEMIRESSDTTEIVNDIVESLFEQSLQESNFRYTGARICQFLATSLKGNPHFSGFKQIFIKRCQKEYNLRDQLKHGSPADQERLRGLCMFMAEIFLNVGTESEDGSIQRLQFLPKFLVNLVNTLLSTPSDSNVKCACQLLKLSGSIIEDIVKCSSEDCIKFEEIFSQLEKLQSKPELTENAKFLIGSVLKLKDADWNRSTSSPPKKPQFLESSNFQAAEPVFYNQLGVPCTRTEAGISDEEDEDGAYILNEEEEAAFLEWQAEQEGQTDLPKWCNDTGYDSYQLDDAADDVGMGDEMEAAYEEFLQKQNFLPDYPPTQHRQVLPTTSPAQEFSGPPQQLPHLLQSNQLPQPQMQPPNPPQNQFPQQQQQQHPPCFPKNDQYHYQR